MNASLTEIYGRVILVRVRRGAADGHRSCGLAAPATIASRTPACGRPVAVARSTPSSRQWPDASATRWRSRSSGSRPSVRAQQGLEALPEPGARAGQPVRFVLMAGRKRVGVAVATVTVSGPHPRAARAIARDEAITEADIDMVDDEWPSVPFQRLPTAADLVGLKARRDIAAGEALTGIVLDVPPLVPLGRRGDGDRARSAPSR